MTIGVAGSGGDRFADLRLTDNQSIRSGARNGNISRLPLVRDCSKAIDVGQRITSRKGLILSGHACNRHCPGG